MSRYIDADFILDGIKFILNDSKELVTSSVVRNAMIGLVERAKTVDAVPVVRCKNCKHRFEEIDYCPMIDLHIKDDDWYCADGERREE